MLGTKGLKQKLSKKFIDIPETCADTKQDFWNRGILSNSTATALKQKHVVKSFHKSGDIKSISSKSGFDKIKSGFYEMIFEKLSTENGLLISLNLDKLDKQTHVPKKTRLENSFSLRKLF